MNEAALDKPSAEDDCTLPPPAIPAAAMPRYMSERDPDAELDIRNYIKGQAHDEEVQHLERIKTEFIVGARYDIWDVTTDKGNWWVITNLVNLYSKRDFPSLDFVLSFHVGLMARMASRPENASVDDPSPFDEVLRRQAQAKDRFDSAIEPEDFQGVGLLLREALLSLAAALRRRVPLKEGVERPKDGNFVDWMDRVVDALCPGSSNKELRHHLKNTSKDTWQLVNWLTHDRGANKTAALIAIYASDTVNGHSMQILERSRVDRAEQCPVCSSRNIRSHFDIVIGDDGDYYTTCGVCRWTTHPGAGTQAPIEPPGA